MPLFMDQHILPGVKAKDVAEAHRLDMMVQGENGCECMTYWVDEKRGNVFCLIEAPNKDAVVAMHQKAHGLVPHKIIEVNEDIVESFLGRIADPGNAETDEKGLKVFEDSAFRVMMMVKLVDPVLAGYQNNANAEWHTNLHSFRKIIVQHDGREVDFAGNYLVASFISINNALDAATEICPLINTIDAQGEVPVIAIDAGDPVSAGAGFFSEALNKLLACCTAHHQRKIVVAAKAAQLLEKEKLSDNASIFKIIPMDEEKFLLSIVSLIEQNFQNPDFDLENCCRSLAISTSQLYRKTVAVCGMPPNQLLRNIRMEKSKAMLRNKVNNVSQVSFDAGFTSPSYFTKCFKKHYGLLPQLYQQSVTGAKND